MSRMVYVTHTFLAEVEGFDDFDEHRIGSLRSQLGLPAIAEGRSLDYDWLREVVRFEFTWEEEVGFI